MVFHSIIRSWRRRKVRGSIARLKGLRVGDIMSRYLITVRPDETVVGAATKMVAEAISCLVVMDGEKLAGIVTERDYLHKVPLSGDAFKMRVRDIMTAGVVTVSPSMSLVDAVHLMKERHFRRLVVEEKGKLLGVVTQNDLLRVISKHFHAYPVHKDLMLDAFMSKDLLLATAKETFSKARDRMHKRNVGCILIVDKPKPPQIVQGIFTEYDIVMQFYEQQGKLQLKELESFMRKYVRALPLGTSAFEATRFALDKSIRRLPVAEGTVVRGIATETDLVRFVFLSLEKISSLLEKPETEFRRFGRHAEFRGEFHGDHLKVYGLA